jgi:hypothetical protein
VSFLERSARSLTFTFQRIAKADAREASPSFGSRLKSTPLNGRELGGRELRLDIAEDRRRPPGQQRDFGPPPDRYARSDYDRGERDGGYERGGGDGRSFDRPKKPKGSRRGLRAKKRSL